MLTERVLAFTRTRPFFPTPTAELPCLRSSTVWRDCPDGRESGATLGGIYWLPRERVSDAELHDHLTLQAAAAAAAPASAAANKRATKRPRNWGMGPRWKVWYIRGNRVGVPRFYGLSRFGPPAEDLRVDGAPMAVDPPRRFEGELRELQTLAAQRAEAALASWGGAVIEAACGMGKTALAIHLSCRFQRRTLVVVPGESILKGWLAALARFAPSLAVWVLREKWTPRKQARWEAESPDLVVSTAASMAECDYPTDVLLQFGFVVIDEAHIIAARTLSQILPKLPARRVLGITATPARKDGLQHALYWLMGPACFAFQRVPEVTGVDEPVDVRQVRLAVGSRVVVTNVSGDIDYSNTLTELIGDSERNAAIVERVFELVRTERRAKVIVFSSRCEHVDLLCGMLCERGLRAGVLRGGVALPAADCEVVVATEQFASKGYDDPALDTLVMAVPFASRTVLQQMIGRIEREQAGKAKPLVEDLVDTFGPFPAMARRRAEFYRSMGFRMVV